jgi:hypothetical protein
MSPELLRALARESADQARCARFFSLTLAKNHKTWLGAAAAEVAAQLADAHTSAAIALDVEACRLSREAT